jgi:peptide methionine sulfoxide reductase MsrB
MNYNKLTLEEEKAIVNKTKVPFKGECNNFYGDGAFVCQGHDATLFPSKSKFDPRCGWPSFDENLSNAINCIADPNGIQTEILCTNCNHHLAHEFVGEHFTDKKTGECVNSLSVFFIPKEKELPKIT